MTRADSYGIFAICGDPGGANAVAPVVNRLLEQTAFTVNLAAYYKAVAVFRDWYLPFTEIPTEFSVEDAQSLLLEHGSQLLFAGTSVNQYELEKKFLAAARNLGIPSIAVLDFWANYAQRFSHRDSDLCYLPDRIAIMDDLAYREMVADGIPEDRLMITGQPAFDAVYSRWIAYSAAERERNRYQFDLGQDDFVVVFVSQPFSDLFGRDHRNPEFPGYDERTVFADLLAGLEELSGRLDRQVSLVVQPHPREGDPWWDRIASESVRIHVTARHDFHSLALCSDLVTGITSTELVKNLTFEKSMIN